MTERNPPVERDPPQAWLVAAAAVVLMALAFGMLGSVGVFLKPMIAAFGWSRGEASMGYTALSLSAAVFGVFWGYFADRWGCRWTTILAVLAMPIALFLLSRTETLWQFYLAYLIFGGFGFAALFSPVIATVGFWFKKNQALAIGIVASGGAAGQGAIPFCARLLITEYDWPTAYLILAVCYLIIGVPLALFIREAPARLAAREAANTEDTTAETVKAARAAKAARAEYPIPPNEAITWIGAAAIFCCICMAVPIVHIVPLVSDRGITPEVAASVLMVIMIAGILGRLFGGVLGGRIGALPAFIFFSLGQSVLAFMFPHISGLTGTYILAVAFGMFYSGDMVSILYCLRVMVPARFAGRALGIGSGLGMIGMGLGGYIGGALYDATGDYVWSFTAASMAGMVNLLILTIFLRRRNRRIAQLAVA